MLTMASKGGQGKESAFPVSSETVGRGKLRLSSHPHEDGRLDDTGCDFSEMIRLYFRKQSREDTGCDTG